MGYPSTVDTGQVQPFMLADPTALSGGAGAVVTAGSAYFVGYVLLAQVTVSQMRTWFGGSPTGQVDMGIYDATGTNNGPGNLLGHTGANTAAAAVFTKSLTANLTLPPGQYWLAILDTVADTIMSRSVNTGGMAPAYKTTATNLTVLPSTAGAIATNNLCQAIEALLLNSFS